MPGQPVFSVVIPVYNRPQELDELLASLSAQTFKSFEVIVVEDGSTIKADLVCAKYEGQLSLRYFFKENSGPGPSRNYGFTRAAGHYLVVFDSDCLIPAHYFEEVHQDLEANSWDAWGGPDRGHEDFTPLQQAMGFTMAAFLTTGGIRGGKKSVGSFQPRSFNMGMSRAVFEATGGFVFDRFAEDIELSVRMRKMGFKVGLITNAFVFHKRRTNLRQFARQVFNFGRGRVLVGRKHPGEIKLTHWFPTVFTLGLLIAIALSLFSVLGLVGMALYAGYLLAIAVSALSTRHSLTVSLLCIPSATVQLTGYGLGFLKEYLK